MDMYLTVLKDQQPEADEYFGVRLLNPTGGSSLSPTNTHVNVTIMANDNAYGRLAFSNSSRKVNLKELDRDVAFSLSLVREFGSFGHVTVSWELSQQDGDGGDITPTKGQTSFMNGESQTEIHLYLRGDSIPELRETYSVR